MNEQNLNSFAEKFFMQSGTDAVPQSSREGNVVEHVFLTYLFRQKAVRIKFPAVFVDLKYQWTLDCYLKENLYFYDFLKICFYTSNCLL